MKQDSRTSGARVHERSVFTSTRAQKRGAHQVTFITIKRVFLSTRSMPGAILGLVKTSPILSVGGWHSLLEGTSQVPRSITKEQTNDPKAQGLRAIGTLFFLGTLRVVWGSAGSPSPGFVWLLSYGHSQVEADKGWSPGCLAPWCGQLGGHTQWGHHDVWAPLSGVSGPLLSPWPLHMVSLKDAIWTPYTVAQAPPARSRPARIPKRSGLGPAQCHSARSRATAGGQPRAGARGPHQDTNTSGSPQGSISGHQL